MIEACNNWIFGFLLAIIVFFSMSFGFLFVLIIDSFMKNSKNEHFEFFHD